MEAARACVAEREDSLRGHRSDQFEAYLHAIRERITAL